MTAIVILLLLCAKTQTSSFSFPFCSFFSPSPRPLGSLSVSCFFVFLPLCFYSPFLFKIFSSSPNSPTLSFKAFFFSLCLSSLFSLSLPLKLLLSPFSPSPHLFSSLAFAIFKGRGEGATLPLSNDGDRVGRLGRPLCNRLQGMAPLSNLYHNGR